MENNKLQTLVKEYNLEEGNNNILFEKIVGECKGTINYFSMKYNNIPMDGEELEQEMVLEIYKSLNKYSEEIGCQYKTYLSRCIEQKLNKLYRDCTRKKRAVKNEDGEFQHSLSYEDLLEQGNSDVEFTGECLEYSNVEILDLLDSLNLSTSEYEICEGLIEGLRPKEIAESIGLSPAMVTYNIKKLKAKLGVAYNLAY